MESLPKPGGELREQPPNTPVPFQRVDYAKPDDVLDLYPFNLTNYLQTLYDHKGTIALITIACTFAALVVWFEMPRIYRAETSLEMLTPNEDYLNLKDIRSTASSPLFSISAEDSQMKTQAEILQQDWLIDRALKRLRREKTTASALPASPASQVAASPDSTPVQAEVVQAVKENLQIEPSHRSRIVRIIYDSPSPTTSADMVNALAQTFIEQSTEVRVNGIKETRDLLQTQLRDVKTKLDKSEAELNAFSTASGLVLTTGQESINENKLRLLQDELSKVEAERINRESLIKGPTGIQSDGLGESDLARQYRTTLTDLRRQLADLGTVLTPENYKVVRLKNQISELEGAIEKEITKGRSRLQEEYEASRRREAVLAKTVDSQTAHVATLSTKMLRYNMMKNELDLTQQFYNSIAQKVNEAGIATAIRPSEARQLSTAQPPRDPHAPSLPLYAGFGMVLGLSAGIGYITLKEHGIHRLRVPGDAEICLGLPELGAIPSARPPLSWGTQKRLASAKWPGVERMSLEQENSDLSESFRGAIVSILSAARTGFSPRSILVSSALPMEGKTTVASNIAITLSQLQKQVVLLDGDLRRPRLHDIFCLDNHQGLSDFLLDKTPVNDVKLEEFIQYTAVSNLRVMPSGPTRTSASRLLYSDRFDDLMQRLLQEFDYVLIDAPPCLKFADARILARRVDGVVLVLRANYTYDKSAIAAAQCFLVDGVPVLGTILNDWNPRISPAYGFDRYSEHYGTAVNKN
jgi:polysaccharide biosynthesis transport protein